MLNGRGRTLITNLCKTHGLYVTDFDKKDVLHFKTKQKDPKSFFAALNKAGLRYRSDADGQGGFVVKIWTKQDRELDLQQKKLEKNRPQRIRDLNPIKALPARIKVSRNLWDSLKLTEEDKRDIRRNGLMTDLEANFVPVIRYSELVQECSWFLRKIHETELAMKFDKLEKLVQDYGEVIRDRLTYDEDLTQLKADLATVANKIDIFFKRLQNLCTDFVWALSTPKPVQAEYSFVEAVTPYWTLISDVWNDKREVIYGQWDTTVDQLKREQLEINASVKVNDKKKQAAFFSTIMELKDEETLEELKTISTRDPHVNIIFQLAESRDHKLYYANITDERFVNVLEAFPKTERVGEYSYTVYTIDGEPIMIIDHLAITADLLLLEKLNRGATMPRVAKTGTTIRTAAVLRLTFTARAALDTKFLDYLRTKNSIKLTNNTWDIPFRLEADKNCILQDVKECFGHSVSMLEVVEDSYRFLNPQRFMPVILTALTHGVPLVDDFDCSVSFPRPRLAKRVAELAASLPEKCEQLTALSRGLKVSAHCVVVPTRDLFVDDGKIKLRAREGMVVALSKTDGGVYKAGKWVNRKTGCDGAPMPMADAGLAHEDGMVDFTVRLSPQSVIPILEELVLERRDRETESEMVQEHVDEDSGMADMEPVEFEEVPMPEEPVESIDDTEYRPKIRFLVP